MATLPLKTITRLYDRLSDSKTETWTGTYRMTLENGIVRLFHYGTLLLEYCLPKNSMQYWYGQSVSDRDALNSLLMILGRDDIRFHFSTTNGFWKTGE